MSSSNPSQPRPKQGERAAVAVTARALENALTMTRAQIIFTRLALLVLVLGAWELLPRLGVVNALLLPPLSQVLATLADLLGRASVQEAVAVTALEVIVAFVIAVPSGAAAGIVIAESDYLSEIFKPILFYVFSIPKSIFLPMFILVFGIGFQQKVAYAAFTTGFVVLMSATAAVESVRARPHPGGALLWCHPDADLLARLRPEYAALFARNLAHLHDLQLYRCHDRRNVRLAHRYRTPHCQLG